MTQFTQIFKDDTKLGHKIPTSEYLTSGKYPIIDQGKHFISGYRNDKHGLYTDIPAIIFGDHTRILKYINVPFFIGADGVKILKPKIDNCNYKYLYYALCNIKIPNTGYNRHFKWLKEANITIPKLNIQNKVVNILDHINNIIQLREQQLSKLDQLVKSRFIEMFGDPVKNPYGWELATVEDVCSSIVRGPFGSALKKEFFVKPDKTTYKVYEQKNAIQKSATIGTYYINKEKYYELRRFECFPGDILMSCSGTMGELYQLPPTSEKGIINQALCKFTLNTKILPVFFLAYMKETIGNLEVKGSGIQNIAAVSYVKAMPINLPPISVQKQFATFCTQVDKSKLPVKQSLETLETLKKSLMQEYFG